MTPHDLDQGSPTPLLRPLRWSTPLVSCEPPGGTLALPAGTVTFLLTDIASSTLQWQAAPGPMAAAVARHYELLDEAIAAHGGVRPEEQGEGDSVVAAFSRASDALGAALAAQQRLHAEDWPTPEPVRVRMAVHTGEAQLRDDANYVGMAIIRTARLRNIAHGGQVLVSSASRDLALDQLGERIDLVDLGEHRLKDLARPERVYQLVHPDLPASFDALRSLDAIPNNLPLQLSTFIGRDAELGALRALVLGNRLVTITGSGGAGKTRLALQAAADLADRFSEGVWWVELAPLAGGDDVGSAVAASVGVREDGATPAVDLVAKRLGDTCSLLVVDNCEHVLDAAADLVSRLLARCPALQVVATSRTVLDVPGEVTWRVPPLQLPDPDRPVAIERLGQFDAVRLFLDRARRARPTFALHDDNAAAVAEVCARLDGIPLAIELAAARTKSLTPQQICDGLGDALRLLTGGSRVVLPRQQTLEASIGWSEALLTDRERALLRRLAVFAGTFDLIAAEAVCAGEGLEAMEVLDALERLLDHSLVTPVEDLPGRFAVLETVRQFGVRMLADAGEETDLRARHARHVARWARTWSPLAETAQQVVAVAALDADVANLRAALAWHRANATAEEFGDLVCDLGPYWDLGGHEAEAEAWFSRALDLQPDRPSALRARLLALRAEARLGLGQFDGGLADAVTAEAEGEDVGDDRAAGRAAWTLAAMTGYLDLEAWQAISDRAIERLGRAGDEWALVEARLWRAVPFLQRGRYLEGLDLLTEMRADVERLGNPTLLSGWLSWRSFAAIGTGALAEARLLAEAAADPAGVSSPAHEGQVFFNLAMTSLLTGQEDSLVGDARRRLDAARRDGEGLAAMSYAIVELARLSIVGDHATVAELADEMLVLPAADVPLFRVVFLALRLDAAFGLGDDGEVDRLLPLARGAAVAAESPFQEAMVDSLHSLVFSDRGEPLAAEAAAQEAIALGERFGFDGYLSDPIEALAVALAGCDDPVGAARVAGIGAAWRDRMGVRSRVATRARSLAAAMELTRSSLGDGAFDAAFGEGRSLVGADAIAYLRRSRGERRRPTHGWDGLTPTERQVVELVRQGLTNRAIADQLLIGAETVKTHLSHVFTKLGARNRATVAAIATERAAAEQDAAG